MLKENKVHKHIDTFNPDVEVYNQERQDLLNLFNAGDWFKNFNEFIHKEAMDFCASGEGTTHLVWNVFYDTDGNEERRELVSYYTLAATSIPYIDRLRKDPEDMSNPEDMYDDKVCGISAIELKMFAVDEKYQDTFFEYDGEDLPISAWIIRSIINHVEEIISGTLGVKAIFLHAVPEAETFYTKNHFVPMLENMNPLGGMDDEFTPMYMSLRDVVINFEI